MKYKKIIYMCIAIIIAVFFLYKFIGNPLQNNKPSTQSQVQNTLSTQTSEGKVTVDATPKTLIAGSQAKFDVRFTTHSGDVNYDLIKIASLIDDLGTKYKAVSWDGNMGGHHAEGVLTFPNIDRSAKKVTLIIPGIDNKDRVFSWDIK